MKNKKFVYVRWYDTEGTRGWGHKKNVKEILNMGLDVAETVGFLVRKDKDVVAVVQSTHIDNRAELLVIPRACVISVETLKKKK